MNIVRHYRGDTWLRSWIIKDANHVPVDLTGATARLHLRNQQGEAVVSATAPDEITITPDTGRIDMIVPAASMVLPLGAYKFDLELTQAGIVTTLEQKTLLIMEDMTRD